MVRVGSRNGNARWSVDGLISISEINDEFLTHGHVLIVANGRLMSWGLASQRPALGLLLKGREEEMARFLIARALCAEKGEV